MKYINIIIFLAVVLAGCKKDGTPAITSIVTNNPVGEAYGGAPAIPSNAAGALYAIQSEVVDSTHVTTSAAAFAWFGNATATLPAGMVSCSGGDSSISQIPLTNTPYPWYEAIMSAIPNSTDWDVSGSSSVAGFTYTDNTLFPGSGSSFSNLSVSSPFSFSITADPYDVAVATLSGSKGVVNQTATPGNSFSFSVAQINTATAVGDTHVGVQITTIKTNAVAIGGKTYYFVKEYAFKQYFTTSP